MIRRGVFSLICLASWLQAEVPAFNRDIRPILSDRCFACHGPDKNKRKADLRLDTIEGATADLGGYQAIVPGKPEKSELIARIETNNPDDLMPPPDSHLALTHDEKQLLRDWIQAGAAWEIHWAFQQIQRPEVPSSGMSRQKENPIDAFVSQELKKRSVTPSPDAGKVAWIRRVTQDLAGLPPRIEDVDAFLLDDSSEARSKVVERLLASQDYAERMTLLWLDNARYADSNGFQFDNKRTMWPWRDWVISAFKSNMPYDQFVTEQLAGDLLDSPTEAQLIATGFNRNHGYSIEGGIIDEEYRVMYANDKTTTFGTLFLGLTLECTRCHDHKYDPLTMVDYYSLFAFFNTSVEKGAPGEGGRKNMAAPPFINLYPEVSGSSTNVVRAMIMKDEPRDSFLLKQGLFDQHGEKLTPGTPSILPSFSDYPKNRLGLARWLTSDHNPLFARVVVNRLWQQFFGVGIVKTSDNFGMQGELPSHPELLDWLASEFRENGWDLKHIIRLIVLSDTYSQSSRLRPELEDPENRLLARGPGFRLAGELIRDQALAVSGLLNPAVGGPSVMPYQPEGVWEDLNASKSHEEKYQQTKGDDLYRKSLYTYWRRAVPHPAMATFDAPSRDVCVVKRELTNTPLQAFVTMHGPIFIEAARKTAEGVVSAQDPIALAFRRTLTRSPSERELRVLSDYYQSRKRAYKESPASADRLLQIGESSAPQARSERDHLAALTDVCHLIFNMSEALTRK
jgi:hypothetical protein